MAHCNSSGGDRGLGVILLVAEVSARRRVIVLFFRRHLCDDWLWGSRATERVAAVPPCGGIDGHFNVWAVHSIFIRYFEQNVLGPNAPKLIRETPIPF